VVVGAGGASRAIVFQLAADGADITVINRTEEKQSNLQGISRVQPSKGK